MRNRLNMGAVAVEWKSWLISGVAILVLEFAYITRFLPGRKNPFPF